ncbi:hypothetical protein PMZ80_000509 [Knufia obscura]|uniref:Uncharacterized protein n=2 Tax=Knufia TaxID=430999 RepID=A0AAN8F4N2_9EURO|nr:hypothetical protein PMZ80_000509 [Knufia obscura]KAK5956563.1 hypothetical protein OHC33_002048 [Knufia fluminis]
MSYAIETKKRKFDRILESLIEPSSPQAQYPERRASLNSRDNASTTKRTLREELLEASKRRRVTPTLSKSTSHSSLLGHYLPSSRAAFLERLETFRHVTKWHIPSTVAINAAEWAKRGWVCADVDTVSCGSCSERVTINLDMKSRQEDDKENQADTEQNNAVREVPMEEGEATDDMAVEVYEALIKRYGDLITTSHSESCPWRRRGCDSAIQRIEGLLNTSNVVSAVRGRFESMAEKIEDVPTVSDLPAYEDLPAPNIHDLEELQFTPANLNALKLAVCGWQYKEADVVECKHCFRSLGLWLYRGPTPTMEHLDAIESHLEYCPWRSSDAQETVLMIHPDSDRSAGKKLKFPGWALAYHAIKKHNLKKKGGADRSSMSISQFDGVDTEREHVSPEQREKKMRDLMRRIKEIKKPFNVKSLLKKKG